MQLQKTISTRVERSKFKVLKCFKKQFNEEQGDCFKQCLNLTRLTAFYVSFTLSMLFHYCFFLCFCHHATI